MKRATITSMRAELRRVLHANLDGLLNGDCPRCEGPCPFCAGIPEGVSFSRLDHMLADAGRGAGFMVAVSARHPEEDGRVEEAPEVTAQHKATIEVVH